MTMTTEHILMTPRDPHVCNGQKNVPTSCWLCDGGLAMCKVCGLVESELNVTPDCPGPSRG